jgi:hypothetical protein
MTPEHLRQRRGGELRKWGNKDTQNPDGAGPQWL